MIIPPGTLSPDVLEAILQEYINREGTDYGERELTLDEKVDILRPQVMRGEVLIVFDVATEQVSLKAKHDVDHQA